MKLPPFVGDLQAHTRAWVDRLHQGCVALHRQSPRVYRLLGALAWVCMGALVGLAAWGPERSAAASVLLPMLMYSAVRRRDAFALAMGYYLAVLRFIPGVAPAWFAGSGQDFLLAAELWWVLASVGSGLLWSLLWTRSSNPWIVAAVASLAYVVLLAPPFGGFITGHPIIGWASIAPAGLGWIALGVGLVLNAGACALVRLHRARQALAGRSAGDIEREEMIWSVLALAAYWVIGNVQYAPLQAGVGDVAAVQTALGEYPKGDEAVMQRIEYAGRVVRALAKMEGGAPRLTVFPESMIGTYDPSFASALRSEIEEPARASGQTVLFGAELRSPSGERSNAAVLIRPQGPPAALPMRQPVPVTLWRPWDAANHMPIDLSRDAVVQVSPEITASVMICYELMLPMLHLMDTLAQPHNVVVGLANQWADEAGVAVAIQEAHAAPMARVFGKHIVIASNTTKAVLANQQKLRSAHQPQP